MNHNELPLSALYFPSTTTATSQNLPPVHRRWASSSCSHQEDPGDSQSHVLYFLLTDKGKRLKLNLNILLEKCKLSAFFMTSQNHHYHTCQWFFFWLHDNFVLPTHITHTHTHTHTHTYTHIQSHKANLISIQLSLYVWCGSLVNYHINNCHCLSSFI